MSPYGVLISCSTFDTCSILRQEDHFTRHASQWNTYGNIKLSNPFSNRVLYLHNQKQCMTAEQGTNTSASAIKRFLQL